MDLDLQCTESIVVTTTTNKRAYVDPRLVNDERVLKNMLRTETYYMPKCNYFNTTQSELLPNMRKMVAEWMLEVCDEQRCEDEVFTLAMNYLDRFLSVATIGKMQLQLLGSVCMLIASKLKETTPLSTEKMIVYTDNSIDLQELLAWENLVLMKLKWDLSAITPYDFFDQILERIPEFRNMPQSLIELVRRHARSFIAITSTDYKFAHTAPSIIAAGSILASVNGLNEVDHYLQPTELVDQFQQIIRAEKEYIINCQNLIEQTVNQNLVQSASGKAAMPQTTSTDITQGATKGQPSTPTDVRDVAIA